MTCINSVLLFLLLLLILSAKGNVRPRNAQQLDNVPWSMTLSPHTDAVFDTCVVSARHAWPHLALLMVDNMYSCVGALISQSWVLTTARCLVGSKTTEVVMGAHDLNCAEPWRVSMISSTYHVHESYVPFQVNYDIGLIQLPEEVEVSARISPTKLPANDVADGSPVTLIGWGKRWPTVVSHIDGWISSRIDCQLTYGGLPWEHICAIPGEASCNCAGAGLMNAGSYLLGLSTVGWTNNCEEGLPDVYTRVHRYLDWIEKKTGITP